MILKKITDGFPPLDSGPDRRVQFHFSGHVQRKLHIVKRANMTTPVTYHPS